MTIRELHDLLRRLLVTNPEFAGAGVAVAEGDGDAIRIDKLVLNRDQVTGEPVLIIQTGAFSMPMRAIEVLEKAGQTIALVAMEMLRLGQLGVVIDPQLGPDLVQLVQELNTLIASTQIGGIEALTDSALAALVDGEPDGGSGEEPPANEQGRLVCDEEV